MAGYQEGSKNRLPTIDMPSLTLVMNLIDTLSVWHIICRGPMSPYGLSICFDDDDKLTFTLSCFL
jgi:hypothetical protein